MEHTLPHIHIEHLHIDTVYLSRRPHASFQWHVGPVVTKGHRMPLDITLTNEQKVMIHLSPQTDAGNPVTLDGPAVFEVSEGTCTIEAVDDTSAYIVSGDVPGDSVVVVTGDADLGAGVETVMDTVMVHVMHANARSLGLSADTPVLR